MGLREEWNKILAENYSIYIYGAGKYGKMILRLLRRDRKERNVCGFLVSDMKNNPEWIEEKPVLQIDALENKEALILVAVSDIYQEEIMTRLKVLQFNNIINAYKYTFLENEMEDSVDVIEVKELLQKQYDGISFSRYDIVVRLLAVKEYYGDNTFGWFLYRKMQNERIYEGYAELSVERFIQLIKSYEANGYDTVSEILVDKNLKLVDGSHRIALAIYYNLSYIKVRIVDEEVANGFGIDWFKKRFDTEDCKRLIDEYEKIIWTIENDKKSDLEKLKEEIYCIFGKNQDFGRGEFYQSLEEIGIKGQRPTEERIQRYGLNDIVKGKRVLDIGCNCGFLDLRLGLAAQSVNGVEHNKSLVKIAEKVKKYLGRKNISFEVGDFKNYTAKRKYDVILSFAVHYWIGLTAEEYCKKIISMLETGGVLVFESQDIEIDEAEFEKYCREFEKNGLNKVKEDKICDDGKITRKFSIYKLGL